MPCRWKVARRSNRGRGDAMDGLAVGRRRGVSGCGDGEIA